MPQITLTTTHIMSRRRDTATPSNLERGGAISPSPARDALQGNLESSLTLNRKRSWFGSARDTLFRALKGDAASRADEYVRCVSSYAKSTIDVRSGPKIGLYRFKTKSPNLASWTMLRPRRSGLSQNVSGRSLHEMPYLRYASI